MGMAEYIEREAAVELLSQPITMSLCLSVTECHHKIAQQRIDRDIIENIHAADVRPVVLCGVCELHGHCYTEDVFAFARLAEENRFCSVGKVKTNGAKREES